MAGWQLALLIILWGLPFLATILVALRVVAWYFRPGQACAGRTFVRRGYEKISTLLIVMALVSIA